MKTTEEKLNDEYENLCSLFGIGNGIWYAMHTNPNRLNFCPANQKSFFAEYLLLEEFVQQAKKCRFIYYYGIDDFLKEYHDAVYAHINIDKE